MPIIGLMDKEILVYVLYRILFNYLERLNGSFCDNMDGT